MNSSIFFSAPRAMGDNIVCNGLYRHYAEIFEICYLPIKRSMYINMTSMLSDLHNIEFIVFPDKVTRGATKVASRIYERLGITVLRFGWDGKNFSSDYSPTWDRNFYDQLNLDFELRWNKYFVPRNIIRENELFNRLVGNSGPYAFIHEDLTRGFILKRELIDPKLSIIKSDPTLTNFSIFDYRKILENAQEIHCMEGSFSALIESEKYNKNLFAHRYARPEVFKNPWHAFEYRLNWKILS